MGKRAERIRSTGRCVSRAQRTIGRELYGFWEGWAYDPACRSP